MPPRIADRHQPQPQRRCAAAAGDRRRGLTRADLTSGSRPTGQRARCRRGERRVPGRGGVLGRLVVAGRCRFPRRSAARGPASSAMRLVDLPGAGVERLRRDACARRPCTRSWRCRHRGRRARRRSCRRGRSRARHAGEHAGRRRARGRRCRPTWNSTTSSPPLVRLGVAVRGDRGHRAARDRVGRRVPPYAVWKFAARIDRDRDRTPSGAIVAPGGELHDEVARCRASAPAGTRK